MVNLKSTKTDVAWEIYSQKKFREPWERLADYQWHIAAGVLCPELCNCILHDWVYWELVHVTDI